MPFDLRGAPATFQQLMDKILCGIGESTSVYIDEILIHSQSWIKHLDQSVEVHERLSQAGLILKLTKCVFGTDECEYLGHKVGKGGVSPLDSKVIAVRDMPRPRTKKEVCTFLNMTGYYRRFVRDYAAIAVPLTELLKKSMPDKILWTPTVSLVFSALKKALISSTVIKNLDPNQTFILQTDISNVGVEAVLSQGEDDRPIAYFCRKLLD